MVRCLIANEIKSSCIHHLASSVKIHYEILCAAGGEQAFIGRQLALGKRRERREERSKKMYAVFSYYYGISENEKACAEFGVDVLSSSGGTLPIV